MDNRKKEIIKANNSGILCPQYEANNIEVIHFHGTKIKESDGKKSVIASAENIKTDNGIKRFKSPVQIKMFTRGDLKCIYFLLDESYKTMLSQVFFFLTKTDKNEFKRIIKNKNYEEVARFLGKCHWLSTPDSFDPEAFFGKFVEFWKECREKETNWAESNNKINEPLLGKGYDRLNNITVSKL